MRRMHMLLGVAALVATPLADPLSAQGALSLQGFGYPTGQMSAASLGVGGSTAEIDPASPINPANLGRANRYSIYMQFEPEFRQTSLGGISEKTSTMRFPAFLVSGAIGRVALGASFSTLLDRTWANSYDDSLIVDGRFVPSTLRAGSNGAMNDARFGASYWVNPRLQFGIGLHAISGENRVEFGRFFTDTSALGDVSQASVINFAGRAFSAGVIGAPAASLLVGASIRLGGSLTAEQAGEPLAEAEVPTRYGITAAWFGIPNTTLSGRFERTQWTAMRSLGTAQMSVFDATELGLGLDVVGPRFAGANTTARVGFRDRTLPFGVNGDQVSERSVTGGFGVPLARGRGQVDLALQRAARSAAGATERAWILSIGLGIRP